MARANPHYADLAGSYLFSEIAGRVKSRQSLRPAADIIRLGIGDVTRPLPPAVVEALLQAVREQSTQGGFRGYGPEQGYDFLREAIVADAYAGLGIEPDEVFVGDGAKSDIGNFQELFAADSRVAITDPVYPVYADSNVMAGRTPLILLPCLPENNFAPEFPRERPDVVYLCYPNNPTGAALSREQLAGWVAYARENDCVILYDAAYEAYVSTPSVPKSIYEIPGAREVAAEFRSYSKTAGFTGLRCGFAVVPRSLRCGGVPLRDMWNRRQTTKYNGCPYIVQRAAAAVHTPEGKRQCAESIASYMANARLIRQAFTGLGLEVYGGVDAPYVWVRLPKTMRSWDFFDFLLDNADVVGTPGCGFGACGEGYFRLTGFGDPDRTAEAVRRIAKLPL